MTKKFLSENTELMKEWDWEATEGLNPNEITCGSNKKVWWLCPICYGKWQATVSDRTRKDNTGCPCCAGRVPKSGMNDLKTKYPGIAKEWNYEKNYPLQPEEFFTR